MSETVGQRGRPKKGAEFPDNLRIVSVRLRGEQREIEAAAKLLGADLSTFIREAALKEARRILNGRKK